MNVRLRLRRNALSDPSNPADPTDPTLTSPGTARPEAVALPAPAATVTLTEVAAAAGVGESTASRVLRNHGSFSAATRERVLEAAARLGYVPNRIAGTLASAGSNLIGILIPSLTNIVFSDVLRGANAVIDAAGYQAVVGVTDYDPRREEALVTSMLAWRPAAMMLAGLEHSERTRLLLSASGARVAELLDLDGPGMDLVVGFSNEGTGEAAARHLLARGYRRIGYLGRDFARDIRAGKRYRGFVSTLAQAGLSLVDEEFLGSGSSVGAGRTGTQALLSRSPAIDALYFANDDMAIGGYFHCLASNIAVPERLALFGHNALDVGRFAPRPLSTVRTPRVSVGETGARLLLDGAPTQVVDLGFELIDGATS